MNKYDWRKEMQKYLPGENHVVVEEAVEGL